MNFEYKELSDGTYFVAHEGGDIDVNRWHVAPDGTILSVKEGGSHIYNRGQIRKNIVDVTGLDFTPGWRPNKNSPLHLP